MNKGPQHGDLTTRTVAMPADLNYNGDVFGGWLLSQMDIAGGLAARMRARGRVTTVAIDAMQFHQPVSVGDELSCYCDLKKIGRSSLTYLVEAWVRRRNGGEVVKVTEGTFVFVAIDEKGKPVPVPVED